MGLRYVRYNDQNRVVIHVNETKYVATHIVFIRATDSSDSSVFNLVDYSFELTLISPPDLNTGNSAPIISE